MDTPYSTREIEAHFKDISESLARIEGEYKLQLNRIEGQNKEQLTRIEVQVLKTNGSVANLKSWKSYITGGLTILTIVIVPAIGYLTYTLLNVDKEITAHIQSTSRMIIK